MIKKIPALVSLIFMCITFSAQSNFSKYYSEGAQSMEKDELNVAIDKFSKAIENKDEAPNNYKIADAYMYRGYCKYLQKNFKSAVSDMDEALKVKPEYVKVYAMKSTIYLTNKKYEDCIKSCDKGLEKNANNDELLFNKSQAFFFMKKYNESLKPLFIMLANNPRDSKAFTFIGATFLHQKMWDSSIVYFSKALEIDPLDLMSLYNRGISRSYTKDTAAATRDILRAMQLDTATKFVGYNNLAFYMKLEKKDFTGAIEYFDKAIELNPAFAYAYSNRGFAKLNLNDIKGAYKDLRKSLELDNTNSYAFKNLGLIYLKDGQKKNACENFKKALELGYTDSYDDEVEKLLKENCN
ncbi:hypothetical protein CNR22_09250 [Sphingobacteriaceae bacterium]|nr:hypothetical protein CNR22_09250 [Sphingobacteriaceae bacterium]